MIVYVCMCVCETVERIVVEDAEKCRKVVSWKNYNQLLAIDRLMWVVLNCRM